MIAGEIQAGVEPAPVPPTPEAVRTEKVYPSGQMMWAVARGTFDYEKPHPDTLFVPLQKISPTSYAALEAQHDQTRQNDSSIRQEKVKDRLRKSGIKDEQMTPALLHHAEMDLWAESMPKIITNMIDKNNPITIATLQKLDFPIPDNPDPATLPQLLKDALYKATSSTTGEYGAFYKKYFTQGAKANELLAKELSEQEMEAIKPLLVNILGGETAFQALKVLCQTQKMLDNTKDDPAKHDELFAAEPTLRPEEKDVYEYFKNGADRVKIQKGNPQQLPNPSSIPPTDPTPSGTAPSNRKEHIRFTAEGSATEANPDHPYVNHDTEFINIARGEGGIFDGAGGHGNDVFAPKIASNIAADKINEVLSAAPSPSTRKEVFDLLQNAFSQANTEVQAQKGGGRTTAAVFKVWEEPGGTREIIVANVGDSRVWIRSKDGTLTQVTEDDNTLRDDYLTLLGVAKTPEEKRQATEWYNKIKTILDDTSQFREVTDIANMLSSIPNLYMEYLKRHGFPANPIAQSAYTKYWIGRNHTHLLGRPNVTPKFFTHQLQEGDTILLTTDGVHDNLTTKEIEAIVRANPDPDSLTKALVAKAKEVSQGSSMRAKKDDITTVAVKLEARAPSPLSDQEAESKSDTKTPKSIEAYTIEENIEAIIKKLRDAYTKARQKGYYPSFGKGKDVEFTPEELSQVKIFYDEVNTSLNANPEWNSLDQTIKELQKDPGVQTALNMSILNVVENDHISKPTKVIVNGQIKVALPPQLMLLWKTKGALMELGNITNSDPTTNDNPNLASGRPPERITNAIDILLKYRKTYPVPQQGESPRPVRSENITPEIMSRHYGQLLLKMEEALNTDNQRTRNILINGLLAAAGIESVSDEYIQRLKDSSQLQVVFLTQVFALSCALDFPQPDMRSIITTPAQDHEITHGFAQMGAGAGNVAIEQTRQQTIKAMADYLQPEAGAAREKMSVEQFKRRALREYISLSGGITYSNKYNPTSPNWNFVYNLQLIAFARDKGQEYTQKLQAKETSFPYKVGERIPAGWEQQAPGDLWRCSHITTKNALRALGYNPDNFTLPQGQVPVGAQEILQQISKFDGLQLLRPGDIESRNGDQREKLLVDWLRNGGVISAGWSLVEGLDARSVFSNAPEGTTLGHSFLLVGVQDNPTDPTNPAIIYHDPYKNTFSQIYLKEFKAKVAQASAPQLPKEQGWLAATMSPYMLFLKHNSPEETKPKTFSQSKFENPPTTEAGTNQTVKPNLESAPPSDSPWLETDLPNKVPVGTTFTKVIEGHKTTATVTYIGMRKDLPDYHPRPHENPEEIVVRYELINPTGKGKFANIKNIYIADAAIALKFFETPAARQQYEVKFPSP